MHSKLESQVDRLRKCDPWEQVVADASPHDHIVQLYQDHDFLNSAVCRYISAGLANGDRIILFPHIPGEVGANRIVG